MDIFMSLWVQELRNLTYRHKTTNNNILSSQISEAEVLLPEWPFENEVYNVEVRKQFLRKRQDATLMIDHRTHLDNIKKHLDSALRYISSNDPHSDVLCNEDQRHVVTENPSARSSSSTLVTFSEPSVQDSAISLERPEAGNDTDEELGVRNSGNHISSTMGYHFLNAARMEFLSLPSHRTAAASMDRTELLRPFSTASIPSLTVSDINHKSTIDTPDGLPGIDEPLASPAQYYSQTGTQSSRTYLKGKTLVKRKRAFCHRSKLGCRTCRARKKKCDEGRPNCECDLS